MAYPSYRRANLLRSLRSYSAATLRISRAELAFLNGREDVEASKAEWAYWFDTERLHSMLAYRAQAEVEAEYFASKTSTDAA